MMRRAHGIAFGAGALAYLLFLGWTDCVYAQSFRLDFPHNNKDEAIRSVESKYERVHWGPEFKTQDVLSKGKAGLTGFGAKAAEWLQKSQNEISVELLRDLLRGKRNGDVIGGVVAINNWKFIDVPYAKAKKYEVKAGLRKVKISGPNSFVPWIAYVSRQGATAKEPLLHQWISLEMGDKWLGVDHDRIVRPLEKGTNDYRTLFEVVVLNEQTKEVAFRSYEGLFVKVEQDDPERKTVQATVTEAQQNETFYVARRPDDTYTFRSKLDNLYLSNEGPDVTADRRQHGRLEQFTVVKRSPPTIVLTSTFYLRTSDNTFLSAQASVSHPVVAVQQPSYLEEWTAATVAKDVVALLSPRNNTFLTAADVDDRRKEYPTTTVIANRTQVGQGEYWKLEPVKDKDKTFYLLSIDRGKYLRVEGETVDADKNAPPGRLEEFTVVPVGKE